jgi:CCR4-NOT transcription complex subunit 4
MTEDAPDCPLCCTPLSKVELEWYPCPCGYQVCGLCFAKINEGARPLCAQCSLPFAPDAVRRHGPQFRPAVAEPEFYISLRTVQILGLPDDLRSPEVLAQPRYLGQYGRILKFALDGSSAVPASKFVLNGSCSIFVKFKTVHEAAICVISLDGCRLGEHAVEASLSLIERCSNKRLGIHCRVPNCMKRHRDARPTDRAMKAAEVDAQGERLRAALRPKKPECYEGLPRSTTALATLPPPRMIHPDGFRFGYSRVYTEKPLNLLEVAASQGPILLTPPPLMRPPQPLAALATILGLE